MNQYFRKYQHIENDANSPECMGILNGPTIIIQPKLDGSNCQVWLENGELIIATRNGIINSKNDNRDCWLKLHKDENLLRFLIAHPTYKLVGEWLVPHSTEYAQNAYYKFYVFDIIDKTLDTIENKYRKGKIHIAYNEIYSHLCAYEINAVPFAIFHAFDISRPIEIPDNIWTNDRYLNGKSIFRLTHFLKGDDDDSAPEGIVIKNYEWVNQYGRQTWYKMLHPHYNHKNKPHVKIIQKLEDNSKTINEFLEGTLIEHFLYKCMEEIGTTDNRASFIKHTQYTWFKEFLPDFLIKHNSNLDVEFIKKCIANSCVKFMRKIKEQDSDKI
jgi:RNA ligase